MQSRQSFVPAYLQALELRVTRALPVRDAVIAGWSWLRLGPFSSFHHGAPNEAWALLSMGAPDTPLMEPTEGLQPLPATPSDPGYLKRRGGGGGGMCSESGGGCCSRVSWETHLSRGCVKRSLPVRRPTGPRCRASAGRVVFVQTGTLDQMIKSRCFSNWGNASNVSIPTILLNLLLPGSTSFFSLWSLSKPSIFLQSKDRLGPKSPAIWVMAFVCRAVRGEAHAWAPICQRSGGALIRVLVGASLLDQAFWALALHMHMCLFGCHRSKI
ncbi:hypothetical protein F7725_005853 [Dissostichus mawsoni]|uniref:Uncharacterized protein n=1 Tax=Dissostichus mawsoni TaxID=36200 RepID=A0A7J5YWM0_DISMA|nr:hypothetical protein F7725_005853 [Dissostichus mawsoni]